MLKGKKKKQMCPMNSNGTNIRNQNPESLMVEIEEHDETIINNTKKNIETLKNINLKISYYTDFINQHWDSNEQKYQNKVKLYLSNLKEIYEVLPIFTSGEEEINTGNCFWKSIKKYALSPILLAAGVSIRVAQRYFSIAVVSDPNIANKTFFEQIKILGLGMWQSLKIPDNYTMGGIDTLLSYFISYYPFGLKNIIELFTTNQPLHKEALNKYLPLTIIIEKLEKHLALAQYEKLNENNPKLSNLCTSLEIIIKKHDLINHFKDELESVDFNHNFSFEQFNILISSIANNEFKNILNDLSNTDLQDEDYSFNKIMANSWSNIKFFTTALLINHLVITGASAYTAQALTWESYKKDIVSTNNIISTVVRATVMKFVNKFFIKNALNTIFEPNNEYTLVKQFKDWVNHQKKPTQALIFITSFIVTTIITNAIKTYAADVTQNKGDWKKAWIQFQATFPKWGMVLSALCVTSSDLYNLTNKMKPSFKLRYKEKEQQKIIDDVLSELLDTMNTENENNDNYDNSAPRNRNHHYLSHEMLEEINTIDNDREHLIPATVKNKNKPISKFVNA